MSHLSGPLDLLHQAQETEARAEAKCVSLRREITQLTSESEQLAKANDDATAMIPQLALERRDAQARVVIINAEIIALEATIRGIEVRIADTVAAAQASRAEVKLAREKAISTVDDSASGALAAPQTIASDTRANLMHARSNAAAATLLAKQAADALTAATSSAVADRATTVSADLERSNNEIAWTALKIRARNTVDAYRAASAQVTAAKMKAEAAKVKVDAAAAALDTATTKKNAELLRLEGLRSRFSTLARAQ